MQNRRKTIWKSCTKQKLVYSLHPHSSIVRTLANSPSTTSSHEVISDFSTSTSQINVSWAGLWKWKPWSLSLDFSIEYSNRFGRAHMISYETTPKDLKKEWATLQSATLRETKKTVSKQGMFRDHTHIVWRCPEEVAFVCLWPSNHSKSRQIPFWFHQHVE